MCLYGPLHLRAHAQSWSSESLRPYDPHPWCALHQAPENPNRAEPAAPAAAPAAASAAAPAASDAHPAAAGCCGAVAIMLAFRGCKGPSTRVPVPARLIGLRVYGFGAVVGCTGLGSGRDLLKGLKSNKVLKEGFLPLQKVQGKLAGELLCDLRNAPSQITAVWGLRRKPKLVVGGFHSPNSNI